MSVPGFEPALLAGKVYGYDAIGSFESIPCGAQGSGSSLVQSILDNQVVVEPLSLQPYPKFS